MKKLYKIPAIGRIAFANEDESLLAESQETQMEVFDEPMIMDKSEIRVKPFSIWDYEDETK
ncbi:MAG: hypothetical protein IJ604_00920 [Prevotella sp.]|nr:hypothetical protein [Prevotella sp.]